MSQNKTSLLLVEDNPGDARLIQTYLTNIPYENYAINLVDSLQNAVLELMDEEPDVVLLDLGLPDSQGLDTLQEFMQHCQQAPVIVLTGNEELTLGREAIKHGAQDFLTKGTFDEGSLVRVIHFAVERKAGEARLRELLSYDPLTALPNRKQFKTILASRLARMPQANVQVGLIDLDIDGFRQVNKRFGYAAGDRYIKRLARTLEPLLGKGDVLARLSSNEFGVITEMPADAPPDQLAQLAQTLQDAIAKVRAGTSDQNSTTLTASAGIASTVDPEVSADSLTRDAEAARQRAKRDGDGLYRYFDDQMETESKRRMAISKAILHAEARDEYRLCWQPILDMEAGKLLGLEVLLRWEPSQGTKSIPPSVFFPVLEESRLAASVGKWIIRNACQQYANWLEEGVIESSVKIFINLSIRQLEDPSLVDTVREAMEANAIGRGTLVLELTEGMLLNASSEILDNLNQLRKQGVEFALDDFGSGLSPLSILFNQPMSYLKIDHNFIKSLLDKPHHAQVTEAILGLGEKFEMQVIGEGVETSQISEKLIQLGCRLQQGYLHARPMFSDALVAWVQNAR